MGIISGTTIGVIKGNTRSLDCSSDSFDTTAAYRPWQNYAAVLVGRFLLRGAWLPSMKLGFFPPRVQCVCRAVSLLFHIPQYINIPTIM